MSLNIYVCRLKKAEYGINEEHYFQLFDDNAEYVNHDFPFWTRKYETTDLVDFPDWDAFYQTTKIDVNEYQYRGFYSDDGEFYLRYENKDGEDVIINYDDIPVIGKEVKIIAYDEVGRQIGGEFTKDFYSDMDSKIIHDFIWTKEELQLIRDKYCENDSVRVNPITHNEFLYSPKTEFQHNIIDNFQQGKDCVYFSY